jgi:hypothetical protein
VLFERLICPGRKVELRLELSPVSVRWSLEMVAVSEELDPPRKLERYLTGEELKNDLVFSVRFEAFKPRSTLVLKETNAGVRPGLAMLNWVLRNCITARMLVY